MSNQNNQEHERYLFCERRFIFFLLMMNSGMMGAYTITQRGGVFCNAQTANIVIMSIAFGQGRWKDGFYYLIPITAYLLGAFLSEAMPSSVKRHGRLRLRWDTWLILVEAAALFLVGFVPQTVPDQIVQVIVNFLASMQYNTFRQAEGIPMATTFCTNHVRQVGVALAKGIRKHDQAALHRGAVHLAMLLGFLGGGALLSFAGEFWQEKSIWVAMVPLGIILVNLIHADLTTERSAMDRKPLGH